MSCKKYRRRHAQPEIAAIGETLRAAFDLPPDAETDWQAELLRQIGESDEALSVATRVTEGQRD